MRTKYVKDKKKCPRCGNVCLQAQRKCDECGLVFSRVDEATNKIAKAQFFKKEKAVLMVKKTPKDVKRINLILLSIFLGPFGAHNFYIGRYIKASFMFIFSLLVLVYVSISNPSTDLLNFISSPFVVLPVAVVAFFWLSDMVQIAFEKYKIPVGLEVEK